MIVALVIFLALSGAFAQPVPAHPDDQPCSFGAVVVDPASSESSSPVFNFRRFKEHVNSLKESDPAAILTFQVLFHCAKEQCCNATTHLRVNSTDIDALESVRVNIEGGYK